MNWKFEAIEKLKQYEAKKLSLQTIPEEIKRLESAMGGIRSAGADGSPVKGGGSGREDMLLSNIVHRQELKHALEQAQQWVAIAEKGLAVLSEEERKILDRFYILPRAMWTGSAGSSVWRGPRFTAERMKRFGTSPLRCMDALKIEKKMRRFLDLNVLYW